MFFTGRATASTVASTAQIKFRRAKLPKVPKNLQPRLGVACSSSPSVSIIEKLAVSSDMIKVLRDGNR